MKEFETVPGRRLPRPAGGGDQVLRVGLGRTMDQPRQNFRQRRIRKTRRLKDGKDRYAKTTQK